MDSSFFLGTLCMTEKFNEGNTTKKWVRKRVTSRPHGST
jgi:hypothetical protein